MAVDLDKAIGEAADQLLKEAGGESAEKAEKTEGEVEVEVEPEEDSDEVSSDDEPDFNEAELDESKKLYRALRDPNTAGAMVAALAQHMGLTLAPPQTRAEVKEAKKSIMEVVSESLGEQYKFLAPTLGKAIESALEVQREEHQTELQEIRQTQVEREVVSAYNRLARETKGESKRLEARMATLSEEVPIGNMTVDTYINRLFSIASSEGQKTSAKQVADKIRRNAGDAPSRLRGTPAGTEPRIPTRKMGLSESVNYALKELTKGR